MLFEEFAYEFDIAEQLVLSLEFSDLAVLLTFISLFVFLKW